MMKNKMVTVVGAVIISTAAAFGVRKGIQILIEKRKEQELLDESE